MSHFLNKIKLRVLIFPTPIMVCELATELCQRFTVIYPIYPTISGKIRSVPHLITLSGACPYMSLYVSKSFLSNQFPGVRVHCQMMRPGSYLQAIEEPLQIK
jgi:hypothetical protein